MHPLTKKRVESRIALIGESAIANIQNAIEISPIRIFAVFFSFIISFKYTVQQAIYTIKKTITEKMIL